MRNQLFNTVQIRKPKSNVFDLSHEKKLSMNMGELVPIYLQEIIPGDKFRVNTELLIRLAPMVAPMMHRVNAYVHYFFVPNRLVFKAWPDFITGGRLGTDATTFPKMTITPGNYPSAFSAGTLWDYLGLPTFTNNHETLYVNALPFRVYHKIWNDYYRDQNMSAETAITDNSTVEVDEFNLLINLKNRCWEKDYLTSCLPWTQRGGDVVLPGTPDYKYPALITDDDGTVHDAGSLTTNASGQVLHDGLAAAEVQNLDGYDISINDLRRATKLQQWLEKNALGGSRYIEELLVHFGIKNAGGDARLQRPEYLGGGKLPIVISEVLNTSDTATAPQGAMAGHGIGVGNSSGFKKFFSEHGFVMGIMSVLPRTAYTQGLPRVFKKFDKFDYYWPEFANIGEQDVLKEEAFYDEAADASVNEATFGYQSRYAEYKFQNSMVHGDFKSSMNYWHMARIFSSQPVLNESFVTADPTHRIFAVTTTTVDKLYVQLYNSVRAIRPMPIFGTPML